MTTIEYEELLEGVKSEKFVLVDLRKQEEIAATAKLPGAHCLPVQDLEEALRLPKDDFQEKYKFDQPVPSGERSSEQAGSPKSIVWYCRSGRRVGLAQEMLQQMGHQGHRLYFGSYLEWVEKGGPVESSN